MTSLSRRKRRTTPWRTTPRRTGISLAVLVAAAAGAPAQPPLARSRRCRPHPPRSRPSARPLSRRGPRPEPGGPLPEAGRRRPARRVRRRSSPSRGRSRTTCRSRRPPAPPGGRTRPEVARLENDEQLLRRITEELKAEERERERRRRMDDPTSQPQPSPPESFFEVPPIDPLVPAGTPYVTKPVREGYPAMRSLTEPDYVVHRRLYFEEKNSERYGWDLGITSRSSRPCTSTRTCCSGRPSSRPTRSSGTTPVPASACRAARCRTTCTRRRWTCSGPPSGPRRSPGRRSSCRSRSAGARSVSEGLFEQDPRLRFGLRRTGRMPV